jgi:hypothetical protein
MWRLRQLLPLLLAKGSTADLDDPLVSQCWKDLTSLQETCNRDKCSNECIGKSDDLFRRWDSCTEIHSGLISAFDQQARRDNCPSPPPTRPPTLAPRTQPSP